MKDSNSPHARDDYARPAPGSANDQLPAKPSPGVSSGVESVEARRVIAELASDWAFFIRQDRDGDWECEWISGSLPMKSDSKIDASGSAPWNGYVIDEDRLRAEEHFSRALDRGADRSEFRLDLPDVGVRWLDSSLRCLAEDEDPTRIRVYGVMNDITDRREMEVALRESELRYRTLVEQALEGILVFDEEGRIGTSNPAAQELFGLTGDALHSKRIAELFHPEELNPDPLAIRNLAAGMTLRSVRRLKRKGNSGSTWAELSAHRLGDGQVQATVRDITSRIEAEERIRHLAYFDTLTALPNRENFREQIEIALERARRAETQLALLFLDVDRFKQVNDTLGHSMGDELLRVVADRLRSAVRGGDSVARGPSRDGNGDPRSPVSRLGGDEFTILVQDLEHPQDAARVARRVLHALSRPVEIGAQEIFVGASVGIAVWPEDGESSEGLLRSADLAMYHAKNLGGNRYEFFSEDMNASSSHRLKMESNLRRALERDEFHVLYQPIRNTTTGLVTAAEALIRWTDAEGNRIPPDQFISIAEETGLIVEIGSWVLRTACRQAVEWRTKGFDPIRMSVNLSVEQLRDPSIASTVDQILFDTGLSAADLELEITETSILDESPNIIAAVSQLTGLGIRFALDDFGTGYSSLSALQRFPIDRLKIDRTFVSGVGENASDEALTSAILALAQRLDHRVVAEGVETEAQARFLTEFGCDELQGYLFSRPLEPEEFEAYLRREEKSEVAAPEGSR